MSFQNILTRTFIFCFIISLLNSCNSKEVELENIDVYAYPNPFSNSVTIGLTSNSEIPVEVYLYNRSYKSINLTDLDEGRIITENPIVDEIISPDNNLHRFDFSEMDPGVYLLDVVVDGKAERITLLKTE